MKSSGLQLNSNKSEFGSQIVVGITCAHPRLGNNWISTSSSIRNLGVFLDSDLTMHIHVCHTTHVCFTMVWQIRGVTAYLPVFETRTLVTSLVLSKLDYCDSALIGLPKTLTSCQACDEKAQVWPHHPHPHWTPLAEDQTQDWVQSDKCHLWSLSASESWLPRILHQKSYVCMTCRVENNLNLFLRCSSSFPPGDSKASGTGHLQLLA